jgi:hypothetical protein
MSIEEYWFSSKSCFSCNGDLKIETRTDTLVQVCKKCGTPNASILKVVEK